MTGVEIAIGIGAGVEAVKLAILALSEFAIGMGIAYIFESSGFTVTPIEEKPDEFSKMKEEILKNPPPIYPNHKNNPYFFNYTLSSNIGLYSNENLGDIHFFSDKAKEIFESSGFKVTKKIYNIPEPETFPINNDIPEPETFPINNDIPHITPHPIDKPNPNFISQPIFVPADNNIKIVFAKKSGNIPERIKKDEEHIDISKSIFGKKIKHKKAYAEKGGWYIEKDDTHHGKSIWKLKDPDGNVIASLGEDGKILRTKNK